MRNKSVLLLFSILMLAGCQVVSEADSLTEPAVNPLATLILINTPTPSPTNTPSVTGSEPTTVEQPPVGEELPPASSPPTAVCTVQTNGFAYSVQGGDTIFSLGQRSNSSVAEIMQKNCLTSDIIVPGQILYLSQRPQPVQSGLSSSTPTSEQPEPITPVPQPATATPTPTSTALPQPTDTSTPTASPTATSEVVAPSGPGDPTLNIVPFSGPPGQQFTISLSGFTANENVLIELFIEPSFDLVDSGQTTVADNGSGVFIYTHLPSHPVGKYVAKATGLSTNKFTLGNFEVEE